MALVFGLLVLPALLVSLPRAVFWPFTPRTGSPEPTDSVLWARIAAVVSRRPARVLAIGVVLLAAMTLELVGTRVGLSQAEQFRVKSESVTAQEALERHLPGGSS